MIVLQWHLGAGGCRELASLDELTQCEDKLLELVCGILEEVTGEAAAKLQEKSLQPSLPPTVEAARFLPVFTIVRPGESGA